MENPISQKITQHSLSLCETDRRALAALVAKTGETENMAIQTAIHSASINTDARRRASAAFHAKRIAEGWRKMTFWVSPSTQKYLELLKATHGTLDKVLEAAIRYEQPIPDEEVWRIMRDIGER